MRATKDSITPRHDQLAEPMDPHGSNLVSRWARGRRQVTPWAYPHLRALGVLRLALGAFLLVVSAVLLSRGDGGWAAIPLAGAVLHFAIGGLDTTVAHSAHVRG
jgi:hypothetical protein